ncbi:Spt4/RpoE2 zinc finger domain containing protein [Rhypophila sp. PSN 637]
MLVSMHMKANSSLLASRSFKVAPACTAHPLNWTLNLGWTFNSDFPQRQTPTCPINHLRQPQFKIVNNPTLARFHYYTTYRGYSTMSENFVAPGQQRYLRACMVCSIVMTQARFREEGCPNCEEFLHLQGSPDQIESCTSQVFEGLITLANPAKSWVAKWQRLDGYVRGVYATKVSGQLPDDVRTTIEEEYRIQYIPRDGSATEAD